MGLNRLETIQLIYKRLASLEDQREVTRLADQDCDFIDMEMKSLREELFLILNQTLTTKTEVSDEKSQE